MENQWHVDLFVTVHTPDKGLIYSNLEVNYLYRAHNGNVGQTDTVQQKKKYKYSFPISRLVVHTVTNALIWHLCWFLMKDDDSPVLLYPAKTHTDPN